MVSPSIRAAVKRVVAGGLLVFSLVGLFSWWTVTVDLQPWTALGTNPQGVGLHLALSLAVTAMFVGVVVATVGIVTETFDRHRRGYLRVVRACGAAGLVGVAGVVVLAVVGAI